MLIGHGLGCGDSQAGADVVTPADIAEVSVDVATGGDSESPADSQAGPSDVTIDTGDDASGDANPADDVSDVHDAATDVAAVTCPECPEGEVCRPERGVCVGAGAVVCDPACWSGTHCGLALPPACIIETCTARTAFPTNVIKLTRLAIPTEPGACRAGGGNALGELAGSLSILSGLLENAVANDRATILLEPTGFDPAGGDGRLTWLFGTLAPDSFRCDPTSKEALCSYTASEDSWDRTTPGTGPCAPWIAPRVTWTSSGFPGTIDPVTSPTETALIPGDRLQFGIPIVGGHVLLQLHRPHLALDVQTAVNPAAAGPGWMSLEGQLCGVLPMEALRAALRGIPEDVLETLGGLDTAEALLEANVTPDTDLDGDGSFDGVSAVLAFEGTRARLVGLSPEGP
jgi:hypothetical protein